MMASISEAGRKYSASPLHAWRRFLGIVFGLALMGAGLWLTVALATHDRGDPSWNQAISAYVKNGMGLPGAEASDALLQWLGLAAWLLPVVLIDWGLRLVTGRGLKHLWLKIAILPLLLVAAAFAVAIVPPFSAWPLKVGLGGVIGKLGRDGIAHINIAPPLSAMAAAALVTLMLLYLLGWSFVSFAPRGEMKPRYVRPSGRRQELAAPRLWARLLAPLALLPPLLRRSGRAAADAAPAEEKRVRREPHLAPPTAIEDEAEEEPHEAPLKRIAKVDLPRRAKNREKERQALLDLVPAGEHLLPPLDMLNEVTPSRFTQVSADALQQNARLLESVLADFGVQGQIVKVRPGPVVALYELEPAPGIKASRVIGLADDIARSMSAISARVAVIPGRNVIGIELPNARRETVFLRELLSTRHYEDNRLNLPLALGKDIGGDPVIADLARMPHLLIGGTTGSGKSVAVNTMILSLLYRLPPDRCRFIMIDPKMLELSVYQDIPHLLTPVVTEPRKAIVALKWVVREMEDRYRAMSAQGVRNIAGYNDKLAEARRKGVPLVRKVQTGIDPETRRPTFEDEEIDLNPLPFIVRSEERL